MRTALVLIDLINDLIHPDGAMPTCAAEVERRRVLAAANQALGRARALGALRLGHWGTEFHADLALEPGDPVLVKHRLSPFHGTALDTVLRAAGIERLLLGGVSTAWALQAAAREGHDRDFRVVLVEDACAAASPQEHDHAIGQFSRLAAVVRADDLAGLADPC